MPLEPGSPAPAAPADAPAEPTFETVRLGGLELEVDSATKAAIEAEVARLTPPAPAQQAPQAPPAPPDDSASPIASIKDLNTRIFTEPDAVLKELYELARTDISNTLRGEYQRVQTERDFWSEFYKDNNDLAGSQFLVKAVVERDRAKLGGLDSYEAIAKHVADATRTAILGIKGVETSSAQRPRAVMRGSQAGARAPASPAAEPSNVTSVTQILRQRHAKRMGGTG